MIFYGNPNELVRFTKKNLRNGNKAGFRFDADGKYETENIRLINALKKRFRYDEDILPIETIEIDSTAIVEADNGIDVVEEEIQPKKTTKRVARGGK